MFLYYTSKLDAFHGIVVEFFRNLSLFAEEIQIWLLNDGILKSVFSNEGNSD